MLTFRYNNIHTCFSSSIAEVKIAGGSWRACVLTLFHISSSHFCFSETASSTFWTSAASKWSYFSSWSNGKEKRFLAVKTTSQLARTLGCCFITVALLALDRRQSLCRKETRLGIPCKHMFTMTWRLQWNEKLDSYSACMFKMSCSFILHGQSDDFHKNPL